MAKGSRLAGVANGLAPRRRAGMPDVITCTSEGDDPSGRGRQGVNRPDDAPAGSAHGCELGATTRETHALAVAGNPCASRMIPLESPVPAIGTPGSESGGRKRAYGLRTAARPRKRRTSHRALPVTRLPSTLHECCRYPWFGVGGGSEGKGRYERPASDRGSSSDDASRASGDASWAVLWLPDALRGRRAAAVAVEVSGLRRLCGLRGRCRAGGAPPAVRGSASAEAQPGRRGRRVRPGDLDGAGPGRDARPSRRSAASSGSLVLALVGVHQRRGPRGRRRASASRTSSSGPGAVGRPISALLPDRFWRGTSFPDKRNCGAGRQTCNEISERWGPETALSFLMTLRYFT